MPVLGERPILCAVLDGDALGRDPAARAEAIFGAGVDWIQLRDREREDAALYALLEGLASTRDRANERLADASGPRRRHRVIVNKRGDLARAARADGVHLGFDALAPTTVRGFLGPEALLGASLHTVDEVAAAAAADRSLDYVHLAPIWNPRSKPASGPPLGLEALAAACAAGVPVLAQGGLDARRAAEAVRAGAAGVAVTGILTGGGAPEAQVRALRRALDAQETGAGG